MSNKAVLVIDMPAWCHKCPLNYEGFCVAKDKDLVMRTIAKPVWCPLKPMPERVDERTLEKHKGFAFQYGLDCGWNDCIDEMLRRRNE